MSQYVIVPAHTGFYAKYPEDTTWNEVIAWRINSDGGDPLPITCYLIYGASYERYEVRTPSGEVESL